MQNQFFQECTMPYEEHIARGWQLLQNISGQVKHSIRHILFYGILSWKWCEWHLAGNVLMEIDHYMVHLIFSADQDSGFSIVTCCDLNSSGFKVQWGQDLPYTSRLALRPTHLSLHWVPGLFPRGKAARAWPLLTTHPLLVQRLNVGRVIPLLPFCASHGMLQGDFYLYMYLICNNESLSTVIII